MKHTHDDDRLTFGCQACITARHHDQLRAAWDEQSNADLYDIWLEHALDEEDDRGLGQYLIERSVLTVDEVAAMYADMFVDEEVA